MSVRNELFVSLKNAIAKYEKVQGREFAVNSKYFLDSLVPYLRLDTLDAYVYQDSLSNDGRYVAKKATHRFSEPRRHASGPLLYFGIGYDQEYICFIRLGKGQYRLYTIGKNGVDERGAGDDIVYDPFVK